MSSSPMHHTVVTWRWFVVLLCCLTSFAPRAVAMSPPATPEAVDVLVILIDFADEGRPTDLRYKDGVDQFVPLTVANAQDVFFDSPSSSAARYAEMSHGLLAITGTVIEASLALDIGESDVSEWRAAADAHAAGQGHPVSNYDRVAYLVPYGFEGQIGLGGAAGDWCWVAGINLGNAYLRESVFSHELGHTLGLSHANVIVPSDDVVQVADQSDLMGLAEAIHAAGVNQWNKGWLDGARHALHPINGVSDYDLYPLADTTEQLQAVHIDNHGAHPALEAPYDTVLSFRKPVGFDGNIALTAIDATGQLLRDTVHVHHARKTGSQDSYLAKALAQGETYDRCGLSIHVDAITPTHAEVEVTQTPYVPVAPSISVVPRSALAVQPGVPIYYDVEVTNHDTGTGACEAFYDPLVTTPGPGWSAGFTSAGLEVSVELGATETFPNFAITAPPGTPGGSHQVSLELTNHSGSGPPVSMQVYFPFSIIATPDTQPPTAPTALVANEFFPDYVVLMWNASTDNEGVQTYRVYRNGALLPDGGNQAAYIDFPAPSGGYTPGGTNGYVVYAVDAAGNVSPPSNFAFVGADTLPPSTPSNLFGAPFGAGVALDWDDSTDDVAVSHYEIRRDGVWAGTSVTSDWVDDAVVSDVVYQYTVVAWDAYGNPSEESAPILVVAPPIPFADVPAMTPGGALLLMATLLLSGSALGRSKAACNRSEESSGKLH